MNVPAAVFVNSSPFQQRHAIHILNGTTLPPASFAPVLHTIGSVFDAVVDVGRIPLAIDRAYEPSRQQHNSTALLAQMAERYADRRNGTDRWIAVVDVDLFIPVLTFVFGEAQLNGPFSVVSTARLDNSMYGLLPDKDLMLERLEKEVIHELGHTFGLLHCHQFECVMRSSTYAEEIDLKKAVPCSVCAARITVLA